MIEDELSPKTIHNAVTLLRTILTGRKGPSAVRRVHFVREPLDVVEAKRQGFVPANAGERGEVRQRIAEAADLP